MSRRRTSQRLKVIKPEEQQPLAYHSITFFIFAVLRICQQQIFSICAKQKRMIPREMLIRDHTHNQTRRRRRRKKERKPAIFLLRIFLFSPACLILSMHITFVAVKAARKGLYNIIHSILPGGAVIPAFCLQRGHKGEGATQRLLQRKREENEKR